MPPEVESEAGGEDREESSHRKWKLGTNDYPSHIALNLGRDLAETRYNLLGEEKNKK